MMKRLSSALALAAIASLTACGGGSGSGTGAVPSAPQAPAQMQSVQFRITIPKNAGRAPQYISSATQSAQVVVTPVGGAAMSPATFNCTSGTCSGTVNAPVGNDQFAVNLYDGVGGAGHVLSSGTATQTIVAGQANSVSLTFGGVVNAIVVSLGAASVVNGQPSSTGVTVVAKDAANSTIVSDAYANPITLTLTDSSGATQLSTTTVSSPTSSVTLTYNGSTSFTSAAVSATASGVSPSNVTGATLTKSAGGGLTPAAYLTQTTALKVNGNVGAGAVSGLIAAISETADEASNGRRGTFNAAQLTAGSGTSAQSVVRNAQSAVFPAAPVDKFDSHDGPDTVAYVHDLLNRVPRVAGRPQSAVRHTRTSTIPGTLVVGTTQAQIWAAKSNIGGAGGITYIQIPSTLEAQTAHGNIWVDNSLLSLASFSSNLNSTASALAADFENAYTSDTSHFASPDYTPSAPAFSQGNYGYYDSAGNAAGSGPGTITEPADKRINVLVVNPTSLGSGVGGFFDSAQYVPQAVWNYYASSACACPGQTVPKSNEAPFIYVGWFNNDTNVQYELQEDIVRGMAHEFQHLINYVNHSISAAAAASPSCSQCSEDPGINEGLSVLSQDLAVNTMFPSTPFDVADALRHAKSFLQAPQNYSITGFYGIDSGSSGPTYNCSGCYGAAYIWQRYLRDRFGGDTYTRGMETSGTVGYANLAANTGGKTAQQLLGDFAMALAAKSQGIAQTGAFNFGTLDITATYTDQLGGTRVMPGVAAAVLNPNSAATLSPFSGGVAFAALSAIPAGGEPISVVDTGTGTFGLVGGLVQK